MPEMTFHISNSQQTRFAAASLSHRAYFYSRSNELADILVDYVIDGLRHGERCLIIATPPNLIALNKTLRQQRVNLSSLMAIHQYCTYDAQDSLDKLVSGNSSSQTRFKDRLRDLVIDSDSGERPWRVVQELTSLLLQQDDARGALQLEQAWEDLVRHQALSLCCIYPSNVFSKTEQTRQVFDDIAVYHTFVH